MIKECTEGIHIERSKQSGDFYQKRLLSNFYAPPSWQRRISDLGGNSRFIVMKIRKEERREEAERKKEEWRVEWERKIEEQESRKEKEREEKERRQDENFYSPFRAFLERRVSMARKEESFTS